MNLITDDWQTVERLMEHSGRLKIMDEYPKGKIPQVLLIDEYRERIVCYINSDAVKELLLELLGPGLKSISEIGNVERGDAVFFIVLDNNTFYWKEIKFL